MEAPEKKYDEFIKGIPDIHDHRFRDIMTQVKDIVKRVVSLTEPCARMEVSRDIELRDLEETLGIMKDIQYRAKRYAGELFVLRNHLQGVEETQAKKLRGSAPGGHQFRSPPNSIASKTGFSPKPQ